MQTNMHILCQYPDWSIYRIDFDDIVYYSRTIHTLLANLRLLYIEHRLHAVDTP